MRTEVPTCTRCCFCIPLRYGLITWAYIKLVANVLIFIMLICTFYSAVSNSIKYDSSSYYKPQAISSGIFSLVIACQIAFIIVLLVGGHKKNVRLLRINYMFTLTVWILTIIGALILVSLTVYTFTVRHFSFQLWLMMINAGSFVASILLEGYFLLILRSEIVKLANSCEFRFENHAVNAQCELRMPEKMDGLNNDVTIVVREDH